MAYITSYYLYPDGQLYDYEPSLSVNNGSVGYSLHIRLKMDFYDDITILYRGTYYPGIRTYFILQFMGDTGMERQLYNYHQIYLQHDYEDIPSMPAGGMVSFPVCAFDDSEGEGIYGCYSNTPDYIYGGGGHRPPVYGAPGVWTDWVNSETYWSQASNPSRYIDTPFEDIPPGPQDSVIFKGGGSD